VAQILERRLAEKQARVRISARHPREVPPTEPTAMENGDGPQRKFVNDCMNAV
jgi:hypothetical protein